MSLRESLRGMVESVEGGICAIIMGYDGIAIDEYLRESSLDVHLLAVEYATVLKEIKRAVEVLKAGAMEEVCINTESSRVILRVINEDLFVLLVLQSNGNFGKGRYLLQRDAPKLRQLLF